MRVTHKECDNAIATNDFIEGFAFTRDPCASSFGIKAVVEEKNDWRLGVSDLFPKVFP
jgi:hypothetical protein